MTLILLFLTTSSAQAWFNGDWAYRHRITLLNSQINGDQLQFPVYLDLQHLPAQFFNNVKSDGADIRLVDNDDVLELPFELVSLDTGSRIGELWFKAPSISSTSNLDFFIYYGNNNGTAYNDNDIYGKNYTWTNGYSLVSHFNQNPSSTFNDSTGLINSFTSNGSMTGVNIVSLDQIDSAYTFDGLNDELNVNKASSKTREIQPHRAFDFSGTGYVSSSLLLPRSDNRTSSFWIKDWTLTNQSSIWLQGNLNLGSQVYQIGAVWRHNRINFPYGQSAYTNTSQTVHIASSELDANQWNHIVHVVDNDIKKAYVNGKLVRQISFDHRNGSWALATPLALGTLSYSLGSTWQYDGKLFDLRSYNKSLTDEEIKYLYTYGKEGIEPDPSFLEMQWKTDDTHPTIAFESTDLSNIGTKVGIVPSVFHYEGNDVPYSFQNSVGYNREGYADNGNHINLDIYSEVDGNWRNGGTTQPDVGFGTFFGKNSKWVTFTPASNTGYGGSRAETDRSVTVVIGQTYSTSSLVRASRNLVGGEQINIYYTGSQGMLVRTLTSSDDLTSDWLYGDVEFSTGGSPGSIGIVAYLQTVVASDITLYLAEHQIIKGSSIDNGTYAPTHGLTTGTFLPKDESKPNANKDIYNGTLSFVGLAPDYALYNGSFMAEFDGVDDRLTIAHDNSLSVGNGSYSVSFLTKGIDNTTNVLALKGASWGGLRSYYIYSAAGTTWSLSIGDGVNSNGISISADGSVLERITMVVDRSLNRMLGYVNDELEDITGIVSLGPTKNTSNLTMGQYISGAHPFNGQVADFRVFNKKLTLNEIRNLDNPNFDLTENTVLSLPFAEGKGTTIHDVSGNDNHGSLTDAQNGELFWSGAKQDLFHYNAQKGFDAVPSFDGGDGVASFSTVTATNEFTVGAFVRLDKFNTGAVTNRATLFTTPIANNSSTLGFFNSTNTRVKIASTWTSYTLVDTNLSLGDWHFVVFRRDATDTVSTYIDGVTDSTTRVNSGSFDFGRLGNYLSIDGFDGSIVNAFIINGTALTNLEVNGLYANFEANILSHNPAVWYRGDEGKGLTLIDSSGNNNDATIANITEGFLWSLRVPANSNGDSLIRDSVSNKAGAFDNHSESNTLIPKSRFDISNGDLLNIQTIFKTNDTGVETLLKKGNNDHGYELRINNGVIEFEAMNKNGNFLVTGGVGFNDDDEHIVHILFDPDTKIEIFIDGQKENETLISNPEKFINAYNVMIASPNTGSNFFSAELDELRFSNTAINANWVNTEYKNIFDTANFYLIDNGIPSKGNSNTMFWGGQ